MVKTPTVATDKASYVKWVLKYWKDHIMQFFWASGIIQSYYKDWRETKPALAGVEEFNKMLFVTEYMAGKGVINAKAFLEKIVVEEKYNSWVYDQTKGLAPIVTEEQQLTIDGGEVPVSSTLPPKAVKTPEVKNDNGVEHAEVKLPGKKAAKVVDTPVTNISVDSTKILIIDDPSQEVAPWDEEEPVEEVTPLAEALAAINISFHQAPDQVLTTVYPLEGIKGVRKGIDHLAPEQVKPAAGTEDWNTLEEEPVGIAEDDEEQTDADMEAMYGPLPSDEDLRNPAVESLRDYRDAIISGNIIPIRPSAMNPEYSGNLIENQKAQIQEVINNLDNFGATIVADVASGQVSVHNKPVSQSGEPGTSGWVADAHKSTLDNPVHFDLVVQLPGTLTEDQAELWTYLTLFTKAWVATLSTGSKADSERALLKAKRASLNLQDALLSGRKNNFQ